MATKQKNVVIALMAIGCFLVGPAITSSIAQAASCGGVTTALIQCSQKGICDDGTNPYEGSNPGDDGDKQSKYLDTYHHKYGACADNSPVSQSINDTGAWGILVMVIQIMTAGVGVLAVGGIVYGAVLYVSAGGSAEQVKKARTVITNVVIGIIAYGLMYAILNFIIPGGLFQQ